MVPKLRFHFEKSVFEKTSLQKITDGIGDGIHATPTYQVNGDYFFINGNNLSNGRIILTENTKKISSEEKEKYRDNLNERSLLLSINGTIGNIAYYNNEPVLLGKSAAYINVSALYCKEWIYFILQSNNVLRYFEQELTGTTIKNLSLRTIRDTVIYAPNLEEQTQIANFLSAVDEKITLLNKQYDLLCQYKKGIMQKIFSQELRFKDENGEEFPVWEQKLISEIAVVNPKSKNLPLEFIYIDLESVEKGRLLKEQLIYKDDAPSRAQRLLQSGDVLFQLVRPYQNNNYLFLRSGNYVASTGYAQLRAKYNSEFLYQLLHLENFTSEVMNRCTGTSYPAINSSDFASIEVEIPCESEQTKIANFLSAIDDKITAKKTELDKLKIWKQGLLQQMFV
ncbi:restriction endonuclease subunit S [Xenorhabdus bovienii]|uniref:restriction endonuclease subunit S n=1 Tax=Xenorhabdus bovienii TaxID=40576 RepID=UPI0023B23181|nr:restriction endonuclease subunit S [Xenorhabdus bovienii]MDE9435868.1 restriction endonuclease subunit S [Xenorhabdus bovienii]MDE9497958.1 restriction endonuclease subunit S [Xenorhabdus bovienii]